MRAAKEESIQIAVVREAWASSGTKGSKIERKEVNPFNLTGPMAKGGGIEQFRKQKRGELTRPARIRIEKLEERAREEGRDPTEEEIADYNKKMSDASVNRELEILRHMFNKAIEWNMMDENPCTKFKDLKRRNMNEEAR